ncbi:hypothetical protein HZC21_01600 [Candidatus Peregrinibacteria bacterium]|nr:hypothetical protein [Candidatus Peregrinibacteria bacterium]
MRKSPDKFDPPVKLVIHIHPPSAGERVLNHIEDTAGWVREHVVEIILVGFVAVTQISNCDTVPKEVKSTAAKIVNTVNGGHK